MFARWRIYSHNIWLKCPSIASNWCLPWIAIITIIPRWTRNLLPWALRAVITIRAILTIWITCSFPIRLIFSSWADTWITCAFLTIITWRTRKRLLRKWSYRTIESLKAIYASVSITTTSFSARLTRLGDNSSTIT